MELSAFLAIAVSMVFTQATGVEEVTTSNFRKQDACGGLAPLAPGQAYHVTGGVGRLACAKLCAQDDRCLSYTTAAPDCLLYRVRLQDCGLATPRQHASYYVKDWCFNGGTLLLDVCVCPGHVVGNRCQYFMKDCRDVMAWKNASGVYWVKPPAAPQPFQVYCQLKYGGRTYLQKNYRHDAQISFNRTWEEYKTGFGNLSSKSFWLGLQQLYWLTAGGNKNLGIQVEYHRPNGESSISSLFYGKFQMKDESADFQILQYRAGSWGYLGKVVNCLRAVIGSKFITFDHGADTSLMKCASAAGAGWWMEQGPAGACEVVCNPNGRLRPKGAPYQPGDVYFKDFDQNLDVEAVYMFIEK